MNKSSTTLSAKCIALILVASIFAIHLNAQSFSKLKFSQPKLVAGANGTIGATYKFANVTPGVDAFITIEVINRGAKLINIDDSINGNYDAWQPIVASPNAVGSSYIKWDIEFKTGKGESYSFPSVNATATDVRYDNANISEFIGVNGQFGYDVSRRSSSLLTVAALSDPDNVNGDDPSDTNVVAFWPAKYQQGDDVASNDVSINYHFTNSSKMKFYTGSIVRSQGTASSRSHSIYFMDDTN